MQDDNCIFCKLAKHEIPTNIVYEDEHVLAFDDMEPLMPVHVLIIPKDHYADIADDVPEETFGHVFAAVKKVAEIKGIREDGSAAAGCRVPTTRTGVPTPPTWNGAPSIAKRSSRKWPVTPNSLPQRRRVHPSGDGARPAPFADCAPELLVSPRVIGRITV